MKPTIIPLENNYFFKIVNEYDEVPTKISNVQSLNILEIKKKRIFILYIDFYKIRNKDYKKILKHLLMVKSIVKISKIEIGESIDSQRLLGYIVNYDEHNKEQNDFIDAINAIFFNTRYERYNYIYDRICEYLDSCFYGKNFCDFKNNKCGEKRNTSSNVGCCRHFKHKTLGVLSKLITCEYLNLETYTCNAKCISCKLFTCDFLKSKGIKFKIKDILLLNVFFNPLQKYFIKCMVFTPKEKIMKRLMLF